MAEICCLHVLEDRSLETRAFQLQYYSGSLLGDDHICSIAVRTIFRVRRYNSRQFSDGASRQHICHRGTDHKGEFSHFNSTCDECQSGYSDRYRRKFVHTFGERRNASSKPYSYNHLYGISNWLWRSNSSNCDCNRNNGRKHCTNDNHHTEPFIYNVGWIFNLDCGSHECYSGDGDWY